MEYIDIRDETGQKTGLVKEREEVHRDGDLHASSHVWIVAAERETGTAGSDQVEPALCCPGETGKLTCRILLQKRSMNKDAYPGCYDISSAGHIPAGEDYLPSALRELYEELGIHAGPEDLTPIGAFTYEFLRTFHGKPFHNREISRVYLYQKPVNLSDLVLQEEEVESVAWMDLSECARRVRAGDPHFCVMEEELQMIADYFGIPLLSDEG